MKPLICTLFLCSFFCTMYAQGVSMATDTTETMNAPKRSTITAGRKWLAGGFMTAGMAGTLLFNNRSMSYEYEQKFHVKNDINAWLQVDKVQHAFLAYTASNWATRLWQWSGMSHKKAAIAGSATAITYLTAKEFLDGHNGNGGWSWADMGANTAGVALFAAQELGWKEQKLYLKVSTKMRTYDATLKDRTDFLFGTVALRRLLKDYNVQTYWLSGNIQTLFHLENFPAWINLAIGRGAKDMYGNYANIAYENDDGAISFNRSDLKRYRQWYIAPDIDLTKIKTNKKVLKTILFVLNSVKIPAPTLELSKGKLKGHVLFF